MLRKKKKVIPQFEHEQIQAENVREYHEGVFFFFFISSILKLSICDAHVKEHIPLYVGTHL